MSASEALESHMEDEDGGLAEGEGSQDPDPFDLLESDEDDVASRQRAVTVGTADMLRETLLGVQELLSPDPEDGDSPWDEQLERCLTRLESVMQSQRPMALPVISDSAKSGAVVGDDPESTRELQSNRSVWEQESETLELRGELERLSKRAERAETMLRSSQASVEQLEAETHNVVL